MSEQRAPGWAHSYAALSWFLAFVFGEAGVVMGLMFVLAPEPRGRSLMWFVAGIALAAIHLALGRGLWDGRRWALRGAPAIHGTVILYLLFAVLLPILMPQVEFGARMLDPVVVLVLIGLGAVWIGARMERLLEGRAPEPPADLTTASPRVVLPERSQPPEPPLPSPTPRADDLRQRTGVETPEEARREAQAAIPLEIGAVLLAILGVLRRGKPDGNSDGDRLSILANLLRRGK